MHLRSGLSIKCIGLKTPGARDKRVTICSENPWGNGIAGARLYPVGYTSGFPSRRDRTTIAQRFSVGSRARTDQVPKGRLKFIPISSRKTCCSFSRPFGTHAIRNSHPNVETSKMHRRCRNSVKSPENCTCSSAATYKTELFSLRRFWQPQRLDSPGRLQENFTVAIIPGKLQHIATSVLGQFSRQYQKLVANCFNGG